MLILTQRPGQSIVLSGGITIRYLEKRGDKIRLGITAPADVDIVRQEVLDRQECADPIKTIWGMV